MLPFFVKGPFLQILCDITRSIILVNIHKTLLAAHFRMFIVTPLNPAHLLQLPSFRLHLLLYKHSTVIDYVNIPVLRYVQKAQIYILDDMKFCFH